MPWSSRLVQRRAIRANGPNEVLAKERKRGRDYTSRALAEICALTLSYHDIFHNIFFLKDIVMFC